MITSKTLRPFVGVLAILVAVSLSTGCVFFSNADTTDRLATLAKVASYVGASEALASNPELRGDFVAARDALQMLETSETIDVVTIVAVLQRLPVKELKSPRATVYVTAGTILISELGAPSVPIDQVKNLKSVVKSIREGFDLALGPTWPTTTLRQLQEGRKYVGKLRTLPGLTSAQRHLIDTQYQAWVDAEDRAIISLITVIREINTRLVAAR